MKGSYEVEELKGFYAESLVVKEPYLPTLFQQNLSLERLLKDLKR